MPRVTVVMATRNRRKRALEACRRLTQLPEAPQLVLVDNASEDGTADAVARELPDVVVLRLDRNHGATARTEGVARAKTPYVAFCDDDSGWAPGSLDRAADYLDVHPRLALLAARIVVRGDRTDPVCEQMAASLLPRAPDLPGPSVLGFVACGAVVRRRAYLQVGGFHPLLFFAGEEDVLAQDLAAAGWGLSYVDDVVAHHDPDHGSGRTGRQRLLVRNAVLSALLRRPLSVPVTRAVQALARDREGRAGVFDAVRMAPAALSQRTFLPPYLEQQVRMLERAHG